MDYFDETTDYINTGWLMERDVFYTLHDFRRSGQHKMVKEYEFWRYFYEDSDKDFEDKYPFLYSDKFLVKYVPVLKKMAQEHYLRGKI